MLDVTVHSHLFLYSALQPSQALRTHIRDRGGIPILIDLLNLDINGIINRTA